MPRRREASAAVRTVELFSGIGGFRIAADRLGLQTVLANDIDPHACAVYRRAFGDDVLVEGDVAGVVDHLPPHDVLTAGFPCQPFSFAGKKDGMSDRRAGTVEVIRAVLDRYRPPVFVLENVRSMLTIAYGRHFRELLATLTGAGYLVEWRVRNLMSLGLPQNRQRLILLGRRAAVGSGTEPEGGYLGWSASARPGAAEVESGRIGRRTASFPTAGIAWGKTYHALDEPIRCLSPFPVAELLEPVVDDRYDFTEATLDRLDTSTRIGQVIDGVEVLWNQEGGRRMGYTVYGVGGAAPTLTSTSSRHYERFLVDGRYRRLTPTEYARLQGFPDDHCDLVPHATRYVLYGNAIPPPLAAWALGCALAAHRDGLGQGRAARASGREGYKAAV
jgi:DNA (cytosine-5)-methyltransferase 1